MAQGYESAAPAATPGDALDLCSETWRQNGRRGLGARLWRRLLVRLLREIQFGAVSVTLPDGARLSHRGPLDGPQAVVTLYSWRAVRRLLLGGDVGFAESYVDGEWSSPDLPALMAFAAANEPQVAARTGGARLLRLLARIRHARRANSRAGSQRNIMAHYDLGNEFYRQWLDAGMSYSSGIYGEGAETLEAAQAAKHARAAALLEVSPGQSVLEIGCGWGSMAALLHERDCAVTGLTLSPAQRDHAEARLAGRGGVAIRLQDYRDVAGVFDRVIAIEMFEAVGEAYWPVFFERVRQLLAPGGIAVLQVISIAGERFEAYRRRPDFIQKHIFPGGMLPSPEAMRAQVARAGLTVEHFESFGASYARTLADWRARFHAAWPRIEMLGFDSRFRRLWDYYLAYCEGGFRTGAIDVGLWRLRAPAHAGD